MTMNREFFTTTEALDLLRRCDDDNRLWKDAMRRVHNAIIKLDGSVADTTLAKYRARYQF